MCRKVLQFFVGSLLIVLIALATVLTILFVTFTSGDTYTTALADADAYTQLADSLQTSLTSYMTGGESADGGVQGDFFGGLPELISDQINAEMVENVVTNNLRNVFSYLNYTSPELLVYIPINQIKSVIDSFTGVYLDGLIEDAISTLPVCSPSMQVDLSQELDCIPPGISAADLKQQLPTEIVSPDYIYSQLATYMPFLNSESENVPIAEVIPELVQEGEVAPWVQVRDVYSWLKVGMLIGWGVNLFLLILFIILAQPKLGEKMQGVGTVAILSGVLVTASGILISLSHSLVLSNLPAMSADFDPQLAENLFGGITVVIGTLTARLLFAGIATMVCGLLVYVLGVVLGRRAKSRLP